MTIRKFIRPEDIKPFQKYVFDELLPETYDTEDIEALEDHIERLEAVAASTASQLEALEAYAKVCRAGIDEDQVRAIANARSAHRYAISVIRGVIMRVEREQNRSAAQEVSQLRKQFKALQNRLDNGLEQRISKAAGQFEGKLRSLDKQKADLHQLNNRTHWLEERTERLILLLAAGDTEAVQQMLWYWQNRGSACGTLRFDEYLKAKADGIETKKIEVA
jgi:DNA repair exonuclease SbcCD ATPase subunit